jgi:hypothetical protein
MCGKQVPHRCERLRRKAPGRKTQRAGVSIGSDSGKPPDDGARDPGSNGSALRKTANVGNCRPGREDAAIEIAEHAQLQAQRRVDRHGVAGDQHGRGELTRQSQPPLAEGAEHGRNPRRPDPGPIDALQDHATAYGLGRTIDGGVDNLCERETCGGPRLGAACRAVA